MLFLRKSKGSHKASREPFPKKQGCQEPRQQHRGNIFITKGVEPWGWNNNVGLGGLSEGIITSVATLGAGTPEPFFLENTGP